MITASWIIHEVVRCLCACVAYDYIKPSTLAYIFILRHSRGHRLCNFIILTFHYRTTKSVVLLLANLCTFDSLKMVLWY